MSLENNTIYKNRYSLYEKIRLGISLIFTKLFYSNAKLICYPIYMRGKKSFVYGKNLNIGYGCRFDLINTSKKTLYVGDNCEIGDYCHFVATDKVEIGDNFLCASKVFISDTNHGRYKGEICSTPFETPNKRTLYSESVKIGKNVWVGDNVVILPGTKIGDGCVVGANAVVSGKYEDNCILAGVPAKVIKKYNCESEVWENV